MSFDSNSFLLYKFKFESFSNSIVKFSILCFKFSIIKSFSLFPFTLIEKEYLSKFRLFKWLSKLLLCEIIKGLFEFEIIFELLFLFNLLENELSKLSFLYLSIFKFLEILLSKSESFLF